MKVQTFVFYYVFKDYDSIYERSFHNEQKAYNYALKLVSSGHTVKLRKHTQSFEDTIIKPVLDK